MRTVLGFAAVTALIGFGVRAQDALTYSVDGRIGLGYLRERTADSGVDGFQYLGPVLRGEATGQVELQLLEPLLVGALARVSWQKGTDSNYDLLGGGTVQPGRGGKFGGTGLDLAIYAATPIVTLSYGEMESAFDFATLEIGHGASILDGGKAVWMNIGDGAGSAGYGLEVSSGPREGPDFRTLRADMSLSGITLSLSKAKEDRPTGPDIKAESAGLVWKGDLAGNEFTFGIGHDKGPEFRFRSTSVGLTRDGLSIVLSKIHREPLVLSSSSFYYDNTFTGASVSYDFGALTLGFARSKQVGKYDNLFAGQASAVWASWEARENVSVDVEYSDSDYLGAGDDTRKASVAVAWEF